MKDINGPWARAPQLVCAILFAAFFNHAIGQTDDSTIDEVVVTAKFQASLADAISQKRSAATQLEAIGLENIGVLPAVSIADAIATLPGVAGARTDDGNIGELSVRGTTDLTLGLLNGREQVTVSSNRNVEYGLYPPSVMTSVQVHKTPIAMMPEGGLSGIINMRTIRPMDFDDRSITVNADLGTYGIGDDTFGADDFGGQFNVTYIDQLSDAFGIALSAAYANEPLGRESAVTPFEWRAFTGGFGAPADVDGDGTFGEEVVPGGFNVEQEGGEEERVSFFAALQWQGENLEVNFDLLTSTRDQEIDTFGFNFIGTTEASGTLVDPQINVRTVEGMAFDEYFAGTITVPATNATGFGSGGSSQYNQDTTVERDTLSTGVNIAWENELWRASGDISFSEAEGDEQIFAGTVHGAPSGGFGGPTFTLTYNALGEDPTLSVLEDLTDPSIFVPRQFEELRLANEDELTAFQFDLERNFDSAGITRISAGLRFTDREKTFDRISNRFTSAVIPDDPTLVLDDSFVVGVATPENGPQYLAWDLGRLRSRFQQMIPQADAALPAPLAENTQLLESGAIQEDSLSGYVQLDFDTELGGLPFSGNVGLRYVDTDLSAPGWSTPSRETVPAFQITPEHSYFEWLPSANFALELTDTQLLRLGLGTVLNRPPLDDMRSSESIFISGFGANGNAGNPMLDPTVADQISLSYEWYPKDATSLVVAVYYNDLESFVGTEFVTRPVVDVGGTPVDVVFQVPGNGDGGYIRGYEFSINTTFGFITEALESFGTSFNYAFTESNVLPVAPGGVGASLTGLSEDVGNLALWWVGGKFEARIGWDYRSEYIEPNAFGNFLNVDDTLLTSFQISYDINEDIRVGLFGRNIGDEVRRKFSFNIPDRTEFNQSFREVYGVRLFWQF